MSTQTKMEKGRWIASYWECRHRGYARWDRRYLWVDDVLLGHLWTHDSSSDQSIDQFSSVLCLSPSYPWINQSFHNCPVHQFLPSCDLLLNTNLLFHQRSIVYWHTECDSILTSMSSTVQRMGRSSSIDSIQLLNDISVKAELQL